MAFSLRGDRANWRPILITSRDLKELKKIANGNWLLINPL